MLVKTPNLCASKVLEEPAARASARGPAGGFGGVLSAFSGGGSKRGALPPRSFETSEGAFGLAILPGQLHARQGRPPWTRPEQGHQDRPPPRCQARRRCHRPRRKRLECHPSASGNHPLAGAAGPGWLTCHARTEPQRVPSSQAIITRCGSRNGAVVLPYRVRSRGLWEDGLRHAQTLQPQTLKIDAVAIRTGL